jgi:putative membrane protein
MSRLMTSVIIKNYATALSVALVIGLLNATIGFILRLPLNLITLFLLTFITRILVTAIVIKIADFFFKGFEVKTFKAALILAFAMAIAGAVFENVNKKSNNKEVKYVASLSSQLLHIQ